MSEVVGTGRRRTELRRRRRRQRRRAVAVVLALAVVATGLVTLYLARQEGPGPAAPASAARTQRTLLVQLRGTDGGAVGSALLADDPAPPAGAGLLVPSQVLATAPGGGPVAFGRVAPDAASTALSDLLGVTVDASWVLDLPTAQRLVDGLGGVSVDVDVPVLDGSTVVLPEGEQLVDGAGALAFVTYRAPGEQEPTRLTRLQQLLDGVLAALPASGEQVTGLLDTLGPGSTVTGSTAAGLAEQLVGLRTDGVAYETLPVLADDGAAGVRLDAPAAQQLVDRLLGPSVR